jgi:hypothetical protein
VDPDSVKLISQLLANTTNQVRIIGVLGESFPSIIGVPQGNALSPILFIIYLQGALNELSAKLEWKYGINEVFKIIYADDMDFIEEIELNENDNISTQNIIENEVNILFEQWNLKMNLDKTEYTEIHKKTNAWKTTKTLGSLLDCNADINNRKQKAEHAFNSLWRLWKKQYNLTVATKVKLYNALIKPLFNMGSH